MKVTRQPRRICCSFLAGSPPGRRAHPGEWRPGELQPAQDKSRDRPQIQWSLRPGVPALCLRGIAGPRWRCVVVIAATFWRPGTADDAFREDPRSPPILGLRSQRTSAHDGALNVLDCGNVRGRSNCRNRCRNRRLHQQRWRAARLDKRLPEGSAESRSRLSVRRRQAHRLHRQSRPSLSVADRFRRIEAATAELDSLVETCLGPRSVVLCFPAEVSRARRA